jgi:hypothetical protein
MIVKPATIGSGFEVNQQLTGAQCSEFVAAGYIFCIRYIPRTAALVKGNLTSEEIADILGSGLALATVQHVSPDNWMPNAELGKSYGEYAAEYAEQIGYPKGATIFLDLEMVSPSATVQDIEDYCHLWFGHVGSCGYVPGLYVGWQTGLSSQQLYDLPYKNYWKGYNADIPVAVRGYQLLQAPQKSLNGIIFDPNEVQKDELGDLPMFVFSS